MSDFKRIHIALLGSFLQKEEADGLLIKQKSAVRYGDAYWLRYHEGEAWVFNYGVAVCWNMSNDERQELFSMLEPIIHNPVARPLSEQYTYIIDDKASIKVHHDHIILDNDDPLSRLAMSHAFAQSEKLGFFEEKARTVIEHHRFLSKELANKGHISLSRKELSKLRGTLFDTSCDISLHFNLLDIPEFFWEYPEVEHYYKQLAGYLDLVSRVNILNKKIETIHALLEMLASEQNHKHSAFLEWIIIVLIAVDILVYFLGD
ncbi:MAG TPA: sad1-interacting factor 2 [Gammaproteobacteria bacterium]|nr:sad1-interacting factor 2 [Gammaproteobacteria bacterium]MEC8009907.1 RMD1 family protein [Pseudomonadota bacterium]HBF08963.1 sad1-interacting factor 2 [Gammaproteobacteria bacterium]HCK91825.1 sad1-interacting factor 2 [Gammaproteobacteria bacterium]|tara:strand:- start:6360 stop:7142 length:783 start_codon:yes stop_codon:yes gene_type:complete